MDSLFAIQIIAFGLSTIYYFKMRGRWEFTIVCTAAWLVSALTVFGANTGHWPIAMFYFLLFLLFTIETYHEVIAEIDFRDNPW